MGKVFKNIMISVSEIRSRGEDKGKINGAAGNFFFDRLFGTRKAKFR